VSLPAETWLGLLEKQGLSIEDAARRARVSRSTLSKALRGQEARQAGWWTSLGKAFGLSYDQSVALCDPSHVNAAGCAMWKARL
jgi:DNA transposition AAA+ family ATPase